MLMLHRFSVACLPACSKSQTSWRTAGSRLQRFAFRPQQHMPPCTASFLQLGCPSLGPLSIPLSPSFAVSQGQRQIAFLGDLNTMAHGIARLSPRFCRDCMRWRSLGQSEGAWFEDNVLAVPDPQFGLAIDASRAGDGTVAGTSGGGTEPANERLAYWGLPRDVCRKALNPGRDELM